MGIITALASGPAKRWTVLISGGAYAFTAVAVLLPRPWRPPASGCRTSGPAAVICDAAGGEPLALAALAVLAAERAGPLSREVAGWCVEDGALGEAVGTLERGRALALHTEMATVDVLSTLSRLGRADLAGEWRGWRDSARRQSEAGHRPDGMVTRPGTAPGDGALLVLGLTGAQARISSSRALHRVYPRPRLLAPEAGRPSGRPDRGPDGTTRPAEVLDKIRRASLSHGIVDISAHLLPDPSDSWRSHLAFGAVPGPDGTQTGDIDRLSVQTVAAQRFPVPPDGPGLCVSLASCMNGLPRRHQDESSTMAAAFLAGGASSVLGSLWLVRLHATALVDLLFHHGLRTGHAPADALRQAQLWMAGPVRETPASMPADVRRLAVELLNALTASGHDPADPAFWAGLVVVGR
ncbi:CHAT domain-containing protein [Streptomyces cyaneofuscatus]|uniref:CHAT domain-containing protein n=1 Tax=Streptomyces cyaneofuscatus TaxID=66883 RepID=UPI003437BA16